MANGLMGFAEGFALTFGEGMAYDHADAGGFIRLQGLRLSGTRSGS